MNQWKMPQAGSLGLLPDAPDLESPAAAWTSGANVRMNDGEVVSFPGHDLGGETTNLDEIWGLFPVTGPSSHYWVQQGVDAGNNIDTFAFDGSTYHDISGPALTGVKSNVLTACFLNGRLILNNGVNTPQSWDLNTGNNLVDLTGFPASTVIGAIAAFKGFLVGIDVTASSTRYGARVIWSDEAAPGSLPSTWTASTTNQAGARDLAGTTADLIAIAPLRDELMLYTARETIGMRLTGGDLVWGFRPVARQAGALTRRAVAAFRGQHLVLTDNDIVLNDGQNVQTVCDRRVRRFLFDQLDESNYGYCFLQPHRLKNEIWVCFPSAGQTYCDLALVWSWAEDTWGVRELPEGCIAAANGLDIVGLTTRTWASGGADDLWDSDSRKWDERSFDVMGGTLLLAGDNTGANVTGAPVFRAEKGNTFNGEARTCRIERLGVSLSENGHENTLHELRIRADGDPFNVRIGVQDSPNGAVQWKVNKTYRPGVDTKVTGRVTGRYHCFALESDTDANWKVQGMLGQWRPGAGR